MRPKVYVLYWLQGTEEELKLSSSDYIETLSQQDSSSNIANLSSIKREFSKHYCRIWSPSMKDPKFKEK
jgi:hypothetical protein